MSSYNDLLNEYKKVFNDKETLRAFLFELCNDKGIDLYMDKAKNSWVDPNEIKPVEVPFYRAIFE